MAQQRNWRRNAIIDLETDGNKPYEGSNILEIGVLITEVGSLNVLQEWSSLVLPQPRKDYKPQFEGSIYDPEVFQKEAITLFDALTKLNDLLKYATVMSFNITFDWGFLEKALREAGYKYDYMKYCIMSMAATYIRSNKLKITPSLENMCKHFGLAPEPKPHRALNGARAAREVLLRMHESPKQQLHR